MSMKWSAYVKFSNAVRVSHLENLRSSGSSFGNLFVLISLYVLYSLKSKKRRVHVSFKKWESFRILYLGQFKFRDRVFIHLNPHSFFSYITIPKNYRKALKLFHLMSVFFSYYLGKCYFVFELYQKVSLSRVTIFSGWAWMSQTHIFRN